MNKPFALHHEEWKGQGRRDTGCLRFQGLWLPEQGLVNARDLAPDTPHSKLIAGWWTARVALSHMTALVPDSVPEIHNPETAVPILGPLYNELIEAGPVLKRERPLYGPAPESALLQAEREVAAQLGVADSFGIYKPEGRLVLRPSIAGISSELGITVDPNPTGLLEDLGRSNPYHQDF